MNRSNAALALLALAACTVAHAETSNCTNLTALPAVISTQGVYCLKQDLSTSISSGAAISVNASNVTLDCNGYKLGGLAAGAGTAAVGFASLNRLNITVRNCNVRGFHQGMRLAGSGGGHLVEDNRFDGNTFTGIYVSGDGSMIRGNSVFSTGGSTYTGAIISWTTGIESSGSSHVIDNTIWGMTPMITRNDTQGITINANVDGTVVGNRVSGLSGTFGATLRLYSSSNRVRIIDNNFSAVTWAVACDGAGDGVLKDNILNGGDGYGITANCDDAGGNFLYP